MRRERRAAGARGAAPAAAQSSAIGVAPVTLDETRYHFDTAEQHPDTGAVLAAEHGPNGGDEVNVIRPGRNYGWPDYSFGRTYEGPRHSDVPLGEDTEQPLILWIPSVAPTGRAALVQLVMKNW